MCCTELERVAPSPPASTGHTGRHAGRVMFLMLSHCMLQLRVIPKCLETHVTWYIHAAALPHGV
jgi:hypothetical protein